jgi:hypothetical protein
MSRNKKLTMLILPLSLMALGGCVSTKQWSASGGDREHGLVRVAYQYPEFKQPTLSDAQAEQLAESRCNAWGYKRAEPIAGQIRECSNKDDGNCDLWTVTREYQCSSDDASYASRLSK